MRTNKRDPHEDTTPDVSHITNPDVAHEESDINVKGVFYFILGLAVLGIVTHLLLSFMFSFFNTREEKAEAAPSSLMRVETKGQRPEEIFPEPRLQVAPLSDLERMRQEEEHILTSYDWVDRNAGIVRMPIDEAKRLVLEKGLPVTEQPAPQAGQPAGQAQEGRDSGISGEPSSGRTEEKRQ
jgi:hypothetical protein